MTAHALAEERERCAEAGMVDHIAKPIDPAILYQTVARWLGRKPAAPATAPEAPHELDGVAGIDWRQGLQRAAGNRTLYLRLMRQFAQREADVGRRVADALRKARHDEVQGIAHSVKGVAGNLGITELQAAAERLEQAVRSRTGTEEGVEAFVRASSILRVLCDQLHETADAGMRDALSGAEAAERLVQLLTASDADAVSFFHSHAQQIRPSLDARRYAELESALGLFDFDRALGALSGTARREASQGVGS